MSKIDEMNRRTREFNNRNVNRFNESTKSNYSSGSWKTSYYNQQTYKSNNGQFSNVY